MRNLLRKLSNRAWMHKTLLVRWSIVKYSVSTYALSKQNMVVRYQKVLGIQWK